jgi:hypothetical protein
MYDQPNKLRATVSRANALGLLEAAGISGDTLSDAPYHTFVTRALPDGKTAISVHDYQEGIDPEPIGE